MANPYWRAHYFEPDPNDPDSNGLVRNIHLHALNLNDNAITGHGSHHLLGDFAIEGTCAGKGKVCF
jgi:hypothetical protein